MGSQARPAQPALSLVASVLLLIGLPVLIVGVVCREPGPVSKPRVQAVPTHPLDPLTAEEIRQAASILRREKVLSEHTRFPLLTLKEPAKEVVLRFKKGDPLPRQAFAVVYDYKANTTHEAVVDLKQRKVVGYVERRDIQPMLFVEEYLVLPEIIRKDERVVAALKKRGIDPAEVQIDLWAPGDGPIPNLPANTRLARGVFYHTGTAKLGHLRPITGLSLLFNLNTRKVVEVIDHELVPVARDSHDFSDPRVIGPLRAPPKPLLVSQPDGPSFQVVGQEVRWQNWRFRFASDLREGLILYQVRYADRQSQGQKEGTPRERSILYRASLAEMVVPYGDPAKEWSWRAAFDQGEYGLGLSSLSLEAGKDVPANARLFSTVLARETGEPVVVSDNVALYERDGGILWKHRDYQGHNEVRRARELVLCQIATVGNYDYGLNWIFGQDGQLRVEVELTGIVLSKGVKTEKCQRCSQLEKSGGKPIRGKGDDRFGTVVARNIIAPNHQHFFCFRLDFDIDGPSNSVARMDVRSDPSGQNAFLLEETLLEKEQSAAGVVNPASARKWKVLQMGQPTALGHFPAYTLEPGGNAWPYLEVGNVTRKRASFIDHHVWVTRYKENERFAAGDYPNQGKGGEGLPKYIADNEALVNEDVVLWYTLGVTHVARPEEWPVMPVARTGFQLVPDGFFTRNPALDVPPPGKK